jgi:hypothetical protein
MGPKENYKYLSDNSPSQAWDLNMWPEKHKAGVPDTRTQHSVTMMFSKYVGWGNMAHSNSSMRTCYSMLHLLNEKKALHLVQTVFAL